MEKSMKNQENLKPLYEFDLEKARVRLSAGNEKIGMMLNWSTLPGDADHMLIAKGNLITSVPGTCSCNCDGCFKSCYARRSILQHHNSVTRSWAENTLMIRHNMKECFRQIDEEIMRYNKKFFETGDPAEIKFKFFRINVAGELESLEELEAWNDLAIKHSYMSFGTYSKNSEVLLKFFEKHGQTAPNFTINISQWHHVMDDTIEKLHKLGAKFNVFEYDDSNLVHNDLSEEDKNHLNKLPHCPAVGPTQANRHPVNPKTGKAWHCDECRGCYTKTGTHRCVYSH